MNCNISLGTPRHDSIGSPVNMPEAPTSDNYPGVYLTFPPGSGVVLPDTGTVTFKYRLTNSGRRLDHSKPADSKAKTTADLDLTELVSYSGEAKSSKPQTAEEALAAEFEKGGDTDEDEDGGEDTDTDGK